MMKGLSGSRSHHHVVACEPSYDPLGHHGDRKPYLIGQIDAPPPPEHPYYSGRSSYQPDCVAVPYGTFPRRHYSSSHELKDECALVPYTGGGASKGQQRVPVNLLEQLDRQLPVSRDGYHTLQYKRAAAAAASAALEQRNDSPGRIRHLVHSVQKLFTKSHSLEGPHHSKGSVNGGGGGGGKASPDGEGGPAPTPRQRKRSKSRERCKSAEPKQRAPPSGYWSSDEPERDICPLRHAPAPPGVMTMGRHPDKSQSQYFLDAYQEGAMLKSSRSNNDVAKCQSCAVAVPSLGVDGTQLVKKSSWSSSLTVSRARQVYQKAAINVDKALVKAEACQQERSCQFLQRLVAIGTVSDRAFAEQFRM
ncbi:hypothetical protein AOLI_G00220270 [Acnodon oligacanthus]